MNSNVYAAFFAEVEKLAEEGTAPKTDPGLWERMKAKATAKMGGKHSARAMQLATKLYKDEGGGYTGKKPSAATNSMVKWTKQEWQARPGTPERAERSSGPRRVTYLKRSGSPSIRRSRWLPTIRS